MKNFVPEIAPPTVLLNADRFAVHRRSFRPDGGEIVTRDIIVHPGSVAILPLFDANRVLMIHNYRYAVDAELLELPAGTLEPPESPEACAFRELEEETGYRAGRIELMGQCYPSPGTCSERMYLYRAFDLCRTEPKRDPGERIRTEILELDDVMERIARNQVQDAKSVALILMHKLCKERMS